MSKLFKSFFLALLLISVTGVILFGFVLDMRLVVIPFFAASLIAMFVLCFSAWDKEKNEKDDFFE